MAERAKVRRAFTLVELLVVIAIIGVLVALLLPAIQAAREVARRLQCQNNLKQMGLGCLNYESAYRALPSAAVFAIPQNCQAGECRGTGLFVLLLPYVEEKALDDLYRPYRNLPLGWINWLSSPHGKRPAPALYICPSEGVWSEQPLRRTYFGVAGGKKPLNTYYRGDVFADGLMYPNSMIKLKKVTDGTSKTLMIGESVNEFLWGLVNYGNADGSGKGGPIWWYAGDDCFQANCKTEQSYGRECLSSRYAINTKIAPNPLENDYPFVGAHPGGVPFVFGDGHVGWFNDEIDFSVYQALSTKAGGETMSDY